MISDLINEFSSEDISFAKTHPRYKAGELGKIDDRLDEDEVALFINLVYWNRTLEGRTSHAGLSIGNLFRSFAKALQKK
ncbi:hypothetical protein [Loigolactobacillus coryniformis]|uniref:hypothetical protein n=1 Tax=Loigolactobacillus coryniformis TaxID=1610 RepID=UPI0002D30B39|nr:hypothetical protein [Loigolactobacillus coryniformis]